MKIPLCKQEGQVAMGCSPESFLNVFEAIYNGMSYGWGKFSPYINQS